MIYCQYCGKKIPEDSGFCPYCGANVENDELEYLYELERNGQPKKERRGMAAIIIGIAAALILLLAVGIGVFMVSNTDSDEDEDVKVVEEEKEEISEAEEEVKRDEEVEKEETQESEVTVAEEAEPVFSPVSMQNITSVSATSELSEYNMTHFAERVTDGDLSTGWVEGVSGQGQNESIVISFDNQYEISGFVINAGYQISSDLYYKNSRPCEIRVSYSDGSSQVYTLQDLLGQQEFILDTPVVSNSVTITILSVYAGNKYQDTVISEIRFY